MPASLDQLQSCQAGNNGFAAADIALQLSSTPQAGYGYYSPYIGVIRDVVRLFGALQSAQLQFIPALGVHHMEGHLLAPMLEPKPPEFPFVALLVSGGHTQLVQVDGIGQYELLGESLDDAAGEAFDKVARILGLPYPGGPAIEKRAHAFFNGNDQDTRNKKQTIKTK